jgi:hypothetical protein
LAAAPTVASACQCEDPASFSATDIEERARWIASRRFVIAEVERLAPSAPHDERYLVVRRLAGSAPEVIRVDHFLTRLASGQVLAAPITSCDYAAPPGHRRVMAFSRGAAPVAAPCSVLSVMNADETMRPAGMCVQYDLEHPPILKRVIALLRR